MGVYPIALAFLFLQRDPDSIQVIARKAPNGVEDDLQMLFDYGDNETGFSATLATSFRSKLQNWAYIIGAAELGLHHRRGKLHRHSGFLARQRMPPLSPGRMC
jgi:hypothetical protein